MDTNNIKNFELDLEEIDRITTTVRPNLRRCMEDYRRTIVGMLESEKKRVEQNKNSTESTTKVEKKEDDKYNLITISKYAFESSDKFAKVYLTDGFSGLKNHPTENIISKFTENSVDITIKNWNGKSFRFSCIELNKNIIPADSYSKAGSSGLTVYLKKEKSEHWDNLNRKEPLVKDPVKPGQKNDDPSAGLMDMMKQMYQNGDDNTKRMIAESWQKAQDGKGEMPKMDNKGKGNGSEGGMDMGAMAEMMKGMGGMPGMGGKGGMPGMPGKGDKGGAGGMDMGAMMEMMKGMGGMEGMGGMPGMPGKGGKSGAKAKEGDDEPDMDPSQMAKMMEMMKGMGDMGNMAEMMKGMEGMKK